MEFYNEITDDYILVREENNGVYLGDIFYTLKDITDPYGVLLDANDQPTFIIEGMLLRVLDSLPLKW